MAKIAGTASFTVNGKKYLLRGNLSIGFNDKQRESIMGLDGYHGIKETSIPAFIECDLTDTSDLDLNLISNLADVTVNFMLINGKSGVLRNAYQINQISLNAEDGLFTVRFEGPTGEWLPVAQQPVAAPTPATPTSPTA